MQFHAVVNANAASRRDVPLLLIVQSDLVESMGSCVVVPLVSASRIALPLARLMPALRVGDEEYVMETQQLSAVHRKLLGHTVADLSNQRHVIMAALDMLFTGI